MELLETIAVVTVFVGVMTFICGEPHCSLRRFIVEISVITVAIVVNIAAATRHDFFLFPALLLAVLLFVKVGACVLCILDNKFISINKSKTNREDNE